MVGKISIGKSFGKCINYCLNDKQKLSAAEKLLLSEKENVQHLNRAEILEYNLCLGNAKELARDFEEVRKLSRRIEKPVLHLTLRLAPEDRNLSKNELIDIGRKCAETFGVANHQYISVLHKDTEQQHIHIVANRVGFDKKVASDSNNYRRMATFCRGVEKEYRLTQVLSPRAFLSPKERLIPRHDSRKEKLKNDIANILNKEQVSSYEQFAQRIQSLGYRIERGRGICFIDEKRARIKGSEVGFPLMTIEKILQLKNEISIKENVSKEKTINILNRQREVNQQKLRPAISQGAIHRTKIEEQPSSVVETLKEEVKQIIHNILKPDFSESYGTYIPDPPKKKKKKRLHL